jgi:hypothetical protein
MPGRLERASAWTGIAAVVLWIVGLLISTSMTSSLSGKASDTQILAWIQKNSGKVIFGAWLFMVGCLCFLWFAGILRSRLAAAEGDPGTLSAIAFAAGAAASVFGLLIPAGDLASAINKNDVSASTAGAFHTIGDMFFLGAELSVLVLLVATGLAALRTDVLPRWWAILGMVIAVVLLIGPIGWAGLIFAFPIWTIVTSVMLTHGARTAPRRIAVPATAQAG